MTRRRSTYSRFHPPTWAILALAACLVGACAAGSSDDATYFGDDYQFRNGFRVLSDDEWQELSSDEEPPPADAGVVGE